MRSSTFDHGGNHCNCDCKSEPDEPANECDPRTMDIERRVSVALSVGRYLRASDKFSEVSAEFRVACKSLRKRLGANQRFVVQVDFRHYLVTTDRDGNFDVEPVPSI